MNCANCGQTLDEGVQFCPRCGRPSPSNPHPRGEGDEPTFIPVRMNDVLDGKWRLERKIGEGGMGTVYLAHDLALDRQVAVKILSASLVGDAEVTARFEREARITAGLEHPNIVPVYAVGVHETRPFMVMKKLDGVTLAQLLKDKGGLTATETLNLMKQLASGLDFIHSKGYVHRDIKAGNIFVGPTGHATILDFGILRPQRGAEALTRTGVVMGTPQYMSPEQAVGIRDIDHRADLYALAVVLFECLTGTLPFEAESELQLIQLQAHAPPPDLVERAPWIPRQVSEVVRRALSKRAEDRYPSAGELVTALEHAFSASKKPDGEPDAAVGSSTAPSWRNAGAKKVSSPQIQVGLASSPALPQLSPSVVVGGAAADPEIRPTPRPKMDTGSQTVADRPSTPRGLGPSTGELEAAVKKSRAPLFATLGVVLIGAAVGLTWFMTRETQARETGTGEVAASDFDAAVPKAFTLAELGDAGPLVAENDEDAGIDLTESEPTENPEAAPGPRDAGHKLARGHKGSKGKLRVITMHQGESWWAVVLIDGVEKGRTPMAIDLPPGPHRVRVERTGFHTEERQVKVDSGREVAVTFSLRP